MRLQRAIIVLLLFILSVPVAAREGVRDELCRLQKQTGLTIEWYYGGVTTAQFAHRSSSSDKIKPPAKHENALLSPDASEIAFPARGPHYHDQPHLTIARRDGTAIAEYPEFADGLAVCWSHDKSKLVVRAKTAEPHYHLFVLDLASRAAKQFGDERSDTSPQCWSPDDKKIVYSSNEEIRVYDVSEMSSRRLGAGSGGTWSPDGQWIAFRRNDGFYAVSPAGGEAKRLFKTKQGRGALFWSPDSRFVAYLGAGGTLRETLRYLDVGLVQLRVRRLSDGSEDWLWQTPDVPPAWSLQFVWTHSALARPK